MSNLLSRALKWSSLLGVAVLALFIIYFAYISGRVMGAAVMLAGLSITVFVYTSARAYVYRYMFPGLAAVAIFVLMPLAYTFYLGFTNYGSKNLLTFERVTEDFLSQTYRPERGADYEVKLIGDGKEFRLLLTEQVAEDASAGMTDEEFMKSLEKKESSQNPVASEADASAAGAVVAKPKQFVTKDALALKTPKALKVKAVAVENAEVNVSNVLGDRDFSERQQALDGLEISLPNGEIVRKTGFSSFGPKEPLYRKNADNSITNVVTSETLRPNFDTGYYVSDTTKQPQIPGFRTRIGFENYKQIFTDKKFSEPFVAIFVWTVVFSALTVFFTLSIGMFLAVLLNWESLRFRAVYRMMLFLPYAVPGFISILVFKGMFRNQGEINMVLNMLFGTGTINWLGDPILAKLMVLMVNTWLGYPYMMVLSMGLIKAIPSDLYEASAIAGAGPLTNFFKITVPLIVKPITPLLIASFAFNFNNYVLIALLTAGRPDFLNTDTAAGHTDLLVSYTVKLAFESTQQFGLAAALSTVIFVLVAVLSVLNLKLTKANQNENRY